MTLLQDVRKDAQYLETHIDAGHGNPNDPKYEDFITDADTLIRNLRRLVYATHPPHTLEEQLSFLVTVLNEVRNIVSQGSLDANAAVHTLQTDIQAAADRTIVAIGDVAALTAARDAALAAQATAEANATAANDAAAASEAARVQAVADAAAAQAALDAATADAAADATTNADTTATATAASATATGIAPSA